MATELYERGLGGDRVLLEGRRIDELPVRTWTEGFLPGDSGLLDACSGPTLDIGCGPGRLAAALLARGVPALGIDVSRAAVALARTRGAAVLQRDVFGRLPREGRWHHLLLADGNVGIGGDPIRLLARCRELLAPDGTVLLDLQGTGGCLRTELVRLRVDDLVSDWFSWSTLPTGALPSVAAAAGLAVRRVWRAERRWQAELAPADTWERPADASF